MKTLTIAFGVLVASEFVVNLYASKNDTTPAPITPEQCEFCFNGICSGKFLTCPVTSPYCASANFTEDGLPKRVSTCKSAADCPSFIQEHESKTNAKVKCGPAPTTVPPTTAKLVGEMCQICVRGICGDQEIACPAGAVCVMMTYTTNGTLNKASQCHAEADCQHFIDTHMNIPNAQIKCGNITSSTNPTTQNPTTVIAVHGGGWSITARMYIVIFSIFVVLVIGNN